MRKLAEWIGGLAFFIGVVVFVLVQCFAMVFVLLFLEIDKWISSEVAKSPKQ